ncbi:MAG: hypothetical protein LBR75_00695, partial [Prevotellaceae bacterium]|nr:hypothetical protein [Prevotellaceae bacterium]
MKKLALILSCSMVAFFANAQDAFDALRFGQTDIYGSARYMSMAGAFSALGGDPLVMTLNPAGLGLYRSSELSLSPNLMINHTNAALGAGEQTENRTRLQFNNVSYVVSADYSLNGKSGVSRGAFGFSFNR